MGRDQGCTHARIEADFLVDGPGIGLEGAGLSTLGFTEYRADQTIEKIDGLVGQAGGQVQARAFSG
jgi:hypothetical protein